MKIYHKENQAQGGFNNGEIIENKPVGFPGEGGDINPFSNLFYWAKASSENGSTIGLHPHQAFEIISFVLKGDIEHYDTSNDKWIPLNEGDVQIIRAGTGIKHAERLNANSELFQIWFNPDFEISLSKEATYNDYSSDKFPVSENNGVKEKVLLGDNSPIQMDSENISFKELSIINEFESELDSDSYYSIYIYDGMGNINNQKVVQDDYIILDDEKKININPEEKMVVFLLKNPKKLSHKTYFEANSYRYR